MRILPLVAAALLIPSAATSQTPVQTVDLYSYGYSPSTIHLTAGRAVTLNLVNRSGHSHDFTARNFFARSHILAGAAPRGEIELAPGESRRVTLVPAAGHYRVHCSHFFHKQFGMRGTIAVD